jgi:hypothetical protein
MSVRVCVAAMLAVLAAGAPPAGADGMMLVNRGPFTMGSDRDASDEGPRIASIWARSGSIGTR